MRTVGITLEDATYEALDAASRDAGLTLAEFVQRAAAEAARAQRAHDSARRDVEGYAKFPLTPDEFATHPDDLKGPDDAAW